ncbi:hypothetical protein [Butyrivibrio sp. FC2001]|uniref:hypothetical protein n=1 Tax=Butyrivibrio sp. FC2001 TaxID=1280671 RepID=UPI0004047764|nr:hypothetical protein [Butyrivibrio sp. FC2001]
MSKFSKLGATALALALSLTMVAPITANAQIIEEYERDAKGKVTNTTYRDEDTKKSLSTKDGYVVIDPAAALSKDPKYFYICTNSYDEYMQFNTTKDVARFENFKGKKGLKVKVIKKREYTDPNPTGPIDADYVDKNYDGYYKNVKGEIVKVDAASALKGDSSGSYTVRFFAKKAGTYKVKYTAVLKDGTTVEKSIKVIARDDGTAIKSVTYAGKVIAESEDLDKPSDNKLWTKGYGLNVTNSKKGVIRVNMNKDFKLKKIEVGTPNIEKKTYADGEETERYVKANSSLDSAYDSAEGVTCTWKKVKNGKKIKLAKVDDSKIGTDPIDPKTTKFESKDTSTTTYIRVTYYDKKNKKTKRTTYTINLVQK